MIRSALIIAAGLGSGLAILSPVAAQAELTLCNRTSYVMDAAIAVERRALVSTRGWFRVDPGQCRPVSEGPLEIDMAYVHTRTAPVYGSAPAPQTGHATFCVREGSFQFSDARGCPVSQQVQFTAAKPVDGGRGPEIHLAEEADYDDAQARLAGIQRLLVIAGYDATPIDGLQGSRTQSALAKFNADRKLSADAGNAADFFDTLLNAANNPEGAGFVWCNETRHAVMAAVGVVEGNATVTRGWYRVAPGRCVRPDLRGDPRRIYSYAEAVDANARAIKRGENTLSWGGDVPMCTRDGRFELSDHKDCAARGLNSAGFALIDIGSQPATTVRFREP